MDYYLKFLPKKGTIVDIGCGYGVLANYLSLNLPDARIIGIDMDKRRIQSASQTVNRDNIEFYYQDVTKWEWPTCSAVIMTDVLHHTSFTEQANVLGTVSKSLDKDGVLFIADVDPDANVRYWLSWLSDHILYPKDKINYRTSWEWGYILKGLGFSVEIIRPKDVLARIIYVCRKNESRIL